MSYMNDSKAYDFEWGPVISWDYNWDERHVKTSEDKKPTATRHLLLIRHASYTQNILEICLISNAETNDNQMIIKIRM